MKPTEPPEAFRSSARLLETLARWRRMRSRARLHEQVATAREALAALAEAAPVADTPWTAGGLRRQLDQIAGARTLARAHYYIDRLKKSLTESRLAPYGEIDLTRWQTYDDDIWTDSLWRIERRDQSGSHKGDYWGNFVPQIPYQLLRRFTRPGEWVLDPFVGSGTTLIECSRLGRHGLGLDLNPEARAAAERRLATEPNPHDVTLDVRIDDARTTDYAGWLHAHRINQVQLVLLHPPYHDIIPFAPAESRNLASQATAEQFLARFADVIYRTAEVLAPERFLAVVIGDFYRRGRWYPLGFESMARAQRLGLTLKSIIVKNFDQTTGKRGQEALWRYRALAGGFYLFKHEYIFLFQRPKRLRADGG